MREGTFSAFLRITKPCSGHGDEMYMDFLTWGHPEGLPEELSHFFYVIVVSPWSPVLM